MRSQYSRFILLTFVGLILGIRPAFSQGEDDVRKVIDTFFEGMRLGDSSVIRSTLMDEVTMITIFKSKEGLPVLVKDSVDQFLKIIGTPHDQVYHEPIWNVVINIDDDFAQVWCDYAFYLDKTFHHCGVDAFHLFKDAGTWKIFHLANTMRKTNCQPMEKDLDKLVR